MQPLISNVPEIGTCDKIDEVLEARKVKKRRNNNVANDDLPLLKKNKQTLKPVQNKKKR